MGAGARVARTHLSRLLRARGEVQRSLVELDSKGTLALGPFPQADAIASARALNRYARSQGAPLLARVTPARPQ